MGWWWCNELTDAQLRFAEVKPSGRLIINIRNLRSPWCLRVNKELLFESEYQYLVPFTSFRLPPKKPTCFNDVNQITCFFAGLSLPWTGRCLSVQEGKVRRFRTAQNWGYMRSTRLRPLMWLCPIARMQHKLSYWARTIVALVFGCSRIFSLHGHSLINI